MQQDPWDLVNRYHHQQTVAVADAVVLALPKESIAFASVSQPLLLPAVHLPCSKGLLEQSRL
jgi:hypothetical protein